MKRGPLKEDDIHSDNDKVEAPKRKKAKSSADSNDQDANASIQQNPTLNFVFNPKPVRAWDALHQAVTKNSYNEVETILKETQCNGIDVANIDGTPLTIACKGGYHDIVTLLLNNCANVNQADQAGLKPLDAAKNYPTIKELLKIRGAKTPMTHTPTSHNPQQHNNNVNDLIMLAFMGGGAPGLDPDKARSLFKRK